MIHTLLSRRSKKSSSNKKAETTDTTQIDKDADVYNINHYKRGAALILYHYEFEDALLGTREGTEIDVAALEEALNLLRFDVEVCNNYTYSQIYDKLNEGKC